MIMKLITLLPFRIKDTKFYLFQVLIRNELAENRKNFLEILRKQTEEVKEKEREIFLASHRFNLVNKENERFVNFIVENFMLFMTLKHVLLGLYFDLTFHVIKKIIESIFLLCLSPNFSLLFCQFLFLHLPLVVALP